MPYAITFYLSIIRPSSITICKSNPTIQDVILAFYLSIFLLAFFFGSEKPPFIYVGAISISIYLYVYHNWLPPYVSNLSFLLSLLMSHPGCACSFLVCWAPIFLGCSPFLTVSTLWPLLGYLCIDVFLTFLGDNLSWAAILPGWSHHAWTVIPHAEPPLDGYPPLPTSSYDILY